MSRQKKRSRLVKLYFRDQNKIMQAIPNLEGLVRDDKLRKVYTLKPGQRKKTIYIIGSDDE